MRPSALAKAKCKHAQDAIDINNKDLKWNMLQKHLQNYKKFITSLTGVTGKHVYRIDILTQTSQKIN